MTSPARILLCRCDTAQVLPRQAVADITAAMAQRRVGILEVGDLCGLAARKEPLLAQLARDESTLYVIACYPRAVRWLFASANASLALERTHFFNLRVQSATEIAAGLLAQTQHNDSSGVQTNTRDSQPAPSQASKLEQPHTTAATWSPWFPVIDFDLCTNCMQCLSFCLFGVYGVSPAGQIAVSHPENCKTNCPACSRVCPEAAIMFPKFARTPINGAEIDPDSLSREAMKVDISALLGGDVYASLRDRSGRAQARFSPDRDPQTALRERQRFLAALVAAGEIPPSVLASLPPLDELLSRFARTKEQAQAQAGPGAAKKS